MTKSSKSTLPTGDQLTGTNVVDAETRFQADTETDLIKRASNGDALAFQQLYQTHHRRVYALCWRLLADATLAEDATQETFVQVWQKLDSFQHQSKFSTWLHSVSTHVALTQLRKQKTWWRRLVSQDDNIPESASTEFTPESSGLDKHIQRLPERARLVFVLFAVEGYRHEEISKMLHMAVGSSKAQYHRARQLLQEWLQDE